MLGIRNNPCMRNTVPIENNNFHIIPLYASNPDLLHVSTFSSQCAYSSLSSYVSHPHLPIPSMQLYTQDIDKSHMYWRAKAPPVPRKQSYPTMSQRTMLPSPSECKTLIVVMGCRGSRNCLLLDAEGMISLSLNSRLNCRNRPRILRGPLLRRLICLLNLQSVVWNQELRKIDKC